MTTYSVSKLFSRSTPRLLLGRSFTWLYEASTVNPLPRYFWIVFALAGDSTMTRPLDNVLLNLAVLELKLARIAASCQLSAISFQLKTFTFCIRDDKIFFTSSTCTVSRSYTGLCK